MMDWHVEYRSQRAGRDLQSSHATRELALDHACRVLKGRQGDTVYRMIGPRGEVVGPAEIEQRYQELLDAGLL
jgi:hypothetical protein